MLSMRGFSEGHPTFTLKGPDFIPLQFPGYFQTLDPSLTAKWSFLFHLQLFVFWGLLPVGKSEKFSTDFRKIVADCIR